MIKVDFLKQELFAKLKESFLEFGFKFNKSKTRFEKISNKCRLIYSFLLHKRANEIALEVFVLIEHLEVSKVYKTATGHSLSSTIGNEIGKLIRNPNGVMNYHTSENLIVKSRNDIPKIEIDIIKYFKEVALPYYEDNANLDRIDEILNNDVNEISVHSNAQYFRCPNGLIVAKLLRRSDYNKLQELYDKKMVDVNKLFRNRYELVKTYLLQMD